MNVKPSTRRKAHLMNVNKKLMPRAETQDLNIRHPEDVSLLENEDEYAAHSVLTKRGRPAMFLGMSDLDAARLYSSSGMTYTAFAAHLTEIFGRPIKPDMLAYRLKACGVTTNPVPRAGSASPRYIARPAGKAEMEDRYLTQMQSVGDIAREFGLSRATVRTWLDELSIPRRDSVNSAAVLWDARYGKSEAARERMRQMRICQLTEPAPTITLRCENPDCGRNFTRRLATHLAPGRRRRHVFCSNACLGRARTLGFYS